MVGLTRKRMTGNQSNVPHKIELEQAIVSHIIKSYIDSNDFNGVPISLLMKTLNIEEAQAKQIILNLLSNNKITLCFPDSGNPHIKRFPDLAVETQIEKLQGESLEHVCAYPSCEVLAGQFEKHDYVDRPFTRALYLGAAQLEARFFDMGVLERYRNDPRYHFDFEYFSGIISIASDHYETNDVPERDQVLLESFGLAISERKDRKIAAFLRYLHNLTPEHQQYWKSYEITSDGYILVPEYYTPSIIGDFPTHGPIYTGILEEIKLINEMCSRIGKPILFRDTFERERPLEFGLFLRPTQRDFDAFIHTADKILSENLNQKFFASWPQLTLETVTENKDGTQTKTRKGTVQLLDEWLRNVIMGADEEDIDKIINGFKEVRKLRQAPAHKIDPNKYDNSYIEKQRDIFEKIYVAVRTIRLFFTNHPATIGVEVPDWLQEGRLRNY